MFSRQNSELKLIVFKCKNWGWWDNSAGKDSCKVKPDEMSSVPRIYMIEWTLTQLESGHIQAVACVCPATYTQNKTFNTYLEIQC